MNREIVFILEPDKGRICVESSNAPVTIVSEIKRDLGQAMPLNCARPQASDEIDTAGTTQGICADKESFKSKEIIYLFRLYHYSTVDGPGRRSVVQLAGCSIGCPGCYVPETHELTNGKPTLIGKIVGEIEKRGGEHDGVTILGGEPFDQLEGLEILVKKLKTKGFHLVIYTGYSLENLLDRNSESVRQILANTDLLIDGPFKREFAKNAGEYKGSSNQRLIFKPLSNENL